MNVLFDDITTLVHLSKDVPSVKNIYNIDTELRVLENKMSISLLPTVIQEAKKLSCEFFEDFSFSAFSSVEEAIQNRYVYVPIFYKLGLTHEASYLAQLTFEYLFPQLHSTLKTQIERLYGKNYKQTCEKIIKKYLSKHDLISHIAYRIKSTHSIWNKIGCLEALTHMSQKEFAEHVNDFIGVRWEMKVQECQNRYDALINGISIAPLDNLKSFRNQQLAHFSGFDKEPVMKLCYVLNCIPLELQILGGNITAYMCAKGYAKYKAKIPLPPDKNGLSKEEWNCRLGMALQSADKRTRKDYLIYMYDELVGKQIRYTEFKPFILDDLPENKKNRLLCFSSCSIPICKLAQLTFEKDSMLYKSYRCNLNGKKGDTHTIQELEILLEFKYLHQIDFETLMARQDIQSRGLEKWKNNEIRAQSQELGTRFIKEIEAGYIPNVSIRWINERLGYGLFAEENLKKGAYVGEYTGIVRQNHKKYFEPLNNYCYEYPLLDCLGRSLVIDATQGNLTRFINHSYKSNLKQTYVFYDGFYHLLFFANDHIAKDSQLSYNYGYNYWYLRGQPADL